MSKEVWFVQPHGFCIVQINILFESQKQGKTEEGNEQV